MKQKQTILVITKTSPIPADQRPGQERPMTILTFPEPYLAKEHLDAYLLAEKKLLAERQGWKPEELPLIPAEQSVRRRIIDEQCGNQTFNILANRYDISWRTIPAEYNVSDDELFDCLQAYVNSSRGASHYKAMAERIADTMHRYCQNELWKFVKALINAFAAANYDDRNKTAHTQAGDLSAYMDINNI